MTWKHKRALVAILVIVLAAGLIFSLNAYKINFTGEAIKEGEDGCFAKNFSVVDASDCKAKCLMIDTEEFNYKPEKGYGVCACLGKLC